MHKAVMAAKNQSQQGQPETIQVVGSGTNSEGKMYRIIKRPDPDSFLWGREIRPTGPRVLDREGGLLVFEDEVSRAQVQEPRERPNVHSRHILPAGLAFA